MKLFNSLAGAVAIALCAPAHATFFGNVQGGAEFPQGAISFADSLVSYTVGRGGVTAENKVPSRALGVPDSTAGSATHSVTLGDGGNIVLEFIDNRLTGSGNNAFDIWIFEVGPDVEDTFIDISKDGVNWTSVGKVFGSTAGIDIDKFGFGTADLFRYIRLTDDTNEGDQVGPSAGADIDAVGAISTRTPPPPPSDVSEPSMLPLLFAMIAGGWVTTRRGRRGVL